jgi:hypothetical protein
MQKRTVEAKHSYREGLQLLLYLILSQVSRLEVELNGH